MLHRWFIGLTLGVALAAGQPAPRTQAWVLALDDRGGLVGDLKADEFKVRVDGKVRPVMLLKNPSQTADASQSWVLVFEPIRDRDMRAAVFLAAADFLTKVPQGDRVLIVARGKDSLESLMPGFSARRAQWAEALAKVPDLLPESFVGSPKETLQGQGFQATFTDQADGDAGQDALNALLARFRTSPSGWAKGTQDQRGINVLDRLNFNNPSFVTGLVATVRREAKALESVLDLVSVVPGQKHVVVFSRCEADDMAHPAVKRAMTQQFKREKGDAGGPAETASLVAGDITLMQASLKAKAAVMGVTLYSVAGAGQNVMGFVGAVASATGGYAFPLTSGLEARFGQAIQVFGSRYFVQWSEDAAPAKPADLEIETARKGVKLFAQRLR